MYAIGTMFGVSEMLYTHIGRYYGNGLVFHNHWKNGAEIISLEEFSKGKSIAVLDVGVDDVSGFYRRVQQVLSNPRPYNFLTNNCEHAASFVRGGIAASPQIEFYGLAGLLAVGIYALSRA